MFGWAVIALEMLLVWMEEKFMTMVPDPLAFSKQPGENECLSSAAA